MWSICRPQYLFIWLCMSSVELLNKIDNFDKSWCYQYQRRLDTIEEDKINLGWTDKDIENIKLEDFTFQYIETKEDKRKATEFIKRYEWLGTVGSYPTHWFSATYNGILGGVIIMGMPNSFSKLMGDNTKDIERLISRGASASWTPKNLGSKFLMWCIKWMVNNTQYRLFTCYSDLQAKERGAIYQALNFYFLGTKNGTNIRCVNPYNKDKIISDRAFRRISFYKRYAKDLGIKWCDNWCSNSSMLWDNIPNSIEKKLRDYSKKMYKDATKITFPYKYKYAFVLGKNKRETKALRKIFEERNKTFEYIRK